MFCSCNLLQLRLHAMVQQTCTDFINDPEGSQALTAVCSSNHLNGCNAVGNISQGLTCYAVCAVTCDFEQHQLLTD